MHASVHIIPWRTCESLMFGYHGISFNFYPTWTNDTTVIKYRIFTMTINQRFVQVRNVSCSVPWHQGPLLQTWINSNPSMDKYTSNMWDEKTYRFQNFNGSIQTFRPYNRELQSKAGALGWNGMSDFRTETWEKPVLVTGMRVDDVGEHGQLLVVSLTWHTRVT